MGERDCIFCKIVGGTLPAAIVFQDDLCMAFMDIRPVNPGHVLVIPKCHAAYLADLDPATGGHVFQIAMRVAGAIRRTQIHCEGINLFLADGEAAMQEVFHVHLHVIPRYTGDGFELIFGDHYFKETPRSDLESARESIVEAWQ
jgi:histidine triad (HIT) family protein